MPNGTLVSEASIVWDSEEQTITVVTDSASYQISLAGGDGYFSITVISTDVTGNPNNPVSFRDVAPGSPATLVFTANDGFSLPVYVSVRNAISTWNRETGTLLITNPTNNVSVNISGVRSGYDIVVTSQHMIQNGSNPSVVTIEGETNLLFTPAQYYLMPDNVVVTNAAYSWNKAEGKLTLFNPSGTTTVSIAGIHNVASISFSLSNVYVEGTQPTEVVIGGPSIVMYLLKQDAGIQLPNTVSVSGATFSWSVVANGERGRLMLSNVTGDVEVTAVGTRIGYPFTCITTGAKAVIVNLPSYVPIGSSSEVRLSAGALSGYKFATFPQFVNISSHTRTSYSNSHYEDIRLWGAQGPCSCTLETYTE